LLVAVEEPPVATERVAEYEARLHTGVTVGAPPKVEMPQAGVTDMEPAVPPVNMQEGVTASVPTVAAENVQRLVHAACRPIRKLFAVGGPHAKAPNDSSCAALVIPKHPPIVRTAVPATKVSGAPTVRVPTAAVRTPVPVSIAVTATGADWVVTWKLPAADLIAYRLVVTKAAAVVGQAGEPPPVGAVIVEGATLM
jgi:hypothetical protein